MEVGGEATQEEGIQPIEEEGEVAQVGEYALEEDRLVIGVIAFIYFGIV